MKNTRIGDVFSVKISEQQKKHFQYISNDLTQLNSDVVRAFKKIYPLEETPDISEIVKDEVDFYAHCITLFGIKFKLWEKVGNTSEVGELNHILFRGSSDSGHSVGQERIKVSHKWYVWRINDKDFKVVGKLEGENKKAELGVVVTPHDLVDRIKIGEYTFFYPGFE